MAGFGRFGREIFFTIDVPWVRRPRNDRELSRFVSEKANNWRGQWDDGDGPTNTVNGRSLGVLSGSRKQGQRLEAARRKMDASRLRRPARELISAAGRTGIGDNTLRGLGRSLPDGSVEIPPGAGGDGSRGGDGGPRPRDEDIFRGFPPELGGRMAVLRAKLERRPELGDLSLPIPTPAPTPWPGGGNPVPTGVPQPSPTRPRRDGEPTAPTPTPRPPPSRQPAPRPRRAPRFAGDDDFA